MIDLNHNSYDNFRQIEDIIDARKLQGQYNVYKQSNGINFRHIYSSSVGHSRNKNTDEGMVLNDRDITLRPTDSEITIVRVRCDDVSPKNRQNKWDMHDIAVPGDGTHLGESPSLVNLVTLVGHNLPCEGEEYLVPLSSWDPFLKPNDIHSDSDLKYSLGNCDSATCSNVNCVAKPDINNSGENDIDGQTENFRSDYGMDLVFRRRSWAGKISNFIRKHCKRSKTLPCLPDQTKNVNSN